MLGACEDQTVCALRSDSRNFAARGFAYLIRTDFEMLVSLRGKHCLQGRSTSSERADCDADLAQASSAFGKDGRGERGDICKGEGEDGGNGSESPGRGDRECGGVDDDQGGHQDYLLSSSWSMRWSAMGNCLLNTFGMLGTCGQNWSLLLVDVLARSAMAAACGHSWFGSFVGPVQQLPSSGGASQCGART